MSKNKLEIDFETADRITVLCLKEHRGYIQKELRAHKKGARLHPEDLSKDLELVAAMDLLIRYFGE